MRFSAGFTLIEMLVVFSLLFTFSTVGIVSYVQFNNTQSLDTSSSEFTTMLNTARMRAVSQVVPAAATICAGQSLKGYQVSFTPSWKDYEVDVLCGGNVFTLDKQKLSNNSCFNSSSSTPVIFNVTDGTTKPATITINGVDKSKVIGVDNAGNVSVSEVNASSACSATPPPTPTIGPTSTPVPTSINTPTPTPTRTPTPTNTPIPVLTNTPTPIPTNTPVPTATNTPVPTSTPTPTPRPAPVLVQKKFVIDTGRATFTANVTAGNLILVAATQWSATVSNVTDSRGNTYTLVGSLIAPSGDDHVQLYYAKNVVGGATTINVNFSSSEYAAVGVYEFSGLDKSAPFDRVVSRTGRSSTPNGGTLVGTQNNELYFAVGVDDWGTGTPVAGSGYTMLDHQDISSNYERFYSEYRISPLGSYNTNFSISSTNNWAVIGASFK